MLVCTIVCSRSQSLPELQFTHVTTKDGLSCPYIRNIFQDSRGLVWLCTTDGLNCYDGNSFRVYRNDPGNANSLPSDDIWTIAEDKKGNFWVGTQTGLCYFEPAQNRFTNYLHDPHNSNTLAYMRAENLVIDDAGFVWVGSLNGLQQFDPVTKKFRAMQFATRADLEKNVKAQSIYQLYIDKKQLLWVNAGGALYQVNRQSFTYEQIMGRASNNKGLNAIYQDQDGKYWLCYWGRGFASFDGVHPPGPSDFVVDSCIYFRMAEWQDLHGGRWLVLTKDDGITFYNKATGALLQVKHDNDKPNSFGYHGAISALTDRDNNTWIAGNGGLDLLEGSGQFFQYHWLGEKKDREDYYFFGTPEPVLKDGSCYWMGLWHGKGLLKVDSNWATIRHYYQVPDHSPATRDRTIFGLYKDAAKMLWISTDRALVRFNEQQNRFDSYAPTDINPEAFEFKKILPAGQNKLFVRSLHYGIYVFDIPSLRFEHHITAESTPGCLSSEIADMAYDNKGLLWVATANGLFAIDTISYRVAASYDQLKNCLGVMADKNNVLWIGTEGSLSSLDLQTKKLTRYTTANGLANNTVNRVMVDDLDNIWAKTANGLSVFHQDTKLFQNFYKENGLPQNDLDGIINKDENGMLYLGNAGIVITVNPADIPYNKKIPPVIITGAKVDGIFQPIQNEDPARKELVTAAGQNSFIVNFSVVNYNASNMNRFYYQLEGVDHAWHESDRGIASYINVPPGKYLLRVKGSNNSGVMNETGDSIRITITPRWYQAWWFKLAIAVLTVLGLFYFVRRRISTVRKEASLKQQIIETEMQALRAQMNPHFIFNSLNSIENFIMQNEKRLASDYLNKFASLIRTILDSSRNELVPVSKDMESLQLYIDLEQLRFNNKFSYSTRVDPVLLNGDYSVPSLLIQPYVENAIVHGLAHSEKKGLALLVTASLQEDIITYTIEDNGIGRQQAAVYNLQNKPHHQSVGLKITLDRIHHFNNGKIAAPVQITDLPDEAGKPGGTKVEIKIKAI